jgi:hypothetical protein
MSCPAEPEEIELRCDAGKLLAVVLRNGEEPSFVRPDNLIELPCLWCRDVEKRRARHHGDAMPRRVLHRFNILGELVETHIVR